MLGPLFSVTHRFTEEGDVVKVPRGEIRASSLPGEPLWTYREVEPDPQDTGISRGEGPAEQAIPNLQAPFGRNVA